MYSRLHSASYAEYLCLAADTAGMSLAWGPLVSSNSGRARRDTAMHFLRGYECVMIHLLLQDVEGLPCGAGGSASSIRDVKRSKKGEVSWLMATTYLTRCVASEHSLGAAPHHVVSMQDASDLCSYFRPLRCCADCCVSIDKAPLKGNAFQGQ